MSTADFEHRDEVIEELNNTAAMQIFRGRINEVLLYFFLCLIVGGYLFYDAWMSSKSYSELFWKSPVSGLIFGMAILFIIAFFSIYGQLPLEKIREHFIKKRFEARSASVHLEGLKPKPLLEVNIRRSAKVADRLFGRAGLYLFVGVLIATGAAGSFLIFFSGNPSDPLFSNIPRVAAVSTDLSQQMLNHVPKFSFLIFLELIAFYFLRQYRVAMEEYRYYEEIQRKREDSMLMFAAIEEHGTDADMVELIKLGRFVSDAGKLRDGESTALLESRKLEKGELEVLERIVQTISGSK